MKIAQIAPLFESTPPKTYGGTERVVSYLTEELVRLGHDVTLFATGDSTTNANLVPCCPQAIRVSNNYEDPLVYQLIQLQMVQDLLVNFDVVHYHTDYLHFPISAKNRSVHVTTLHGRLNIPELFPLYEMFNEVPVVSISNNQRTPLPHANWVGTVYHGLPPYLYKYVKEEGKYLAFIGRISPEKRVDRAIEVAKRSGIPLKIAAKIDKVDQEYFDHKVKHLLDHPLIEFIGEIGEVEKSEFLGNAMALLFPIDWPEPFGLVMIESMACGTPVIAWPHGSVPEILDNGLTGYIVDSIDGAVGAVKKIHNIHRANCREMFECRFSINRMTEDYLRIYNQQLELEQLHAPPGSDKFKMFM